MSTMIYIEFFENSNQKLAVVEKEETFLDLPCSKGRQEIIPEIGELLPSKFRFVAWGSPLSLVQESTYSVRKCAIEVKDKNDYPDNVGVYRVYLRALKAEESPKTPNASNDFQLATASSSNMGAKAVDRLIENLNEQKQSLEYRLQIAQATVSSLKEKPKERRTIGGNPSFTCSNCHFKGHRVTACHQPPCQGYFECGNSLQHKEHREEVRTAENELKEVLRLLKGNKEELENTKLLKERTKSNFFSIMRSRLHCLNPVKYSNRVVLDNDLRVLAAACKHKVPLQGVNLEDIIQSYRKKAQSECGFPVVNPQDWQSPMNRPRPWVGSPSVINPQDWLSPVNRPRPWGGSPSVINPQDWQSPVNRPRPWGGSPNVNNYFTKCNSSQCYSGWSPNHVSPSPQPAFRGRGWQEGISARLPTPFYRSSPVVGSDTCQSRKRLNYMNPNNMISKKSKQSPGKVFRAGLMERYTNNQLSTASPMTSTPKKDLVHVHDVDSEETGEVHNTSTDSSQTQ